MSQLSVYKLSDMLREHVCRRMVGCSCHWWLIRMVAYRPTILQEVAYSVVMVIFKAESPLWYVKGALDWYFGSHEVGKSCCFDGIIKSSEFGKEFFSFHCSDWPEFLYYDFLFADSFVR